MIQLMLMLVIASVLLVDEQEQELGLLKTAGDVMVLIK
jgi:hypothetical protein